MKCTKCYELMNEVMRILILFVFLYQLALSAPGAWDDVRN